MKLSNLFLLYFFFLLSGVFSLQAFYGTIQEVTPENRKILNDIVRGHLTKKLRSYNPEAFTFAVVFLPLAPLCFKIASFALRNKEIQQGGIIIGLTMMGLGITCTGFGLFPFGWALVGRNASPLELAKEMNQQRGAYARLRYRLAVEAIMQQWFKNMEEDLKNFVSLDCEAKLSEDKHKVFYSVFGDTKIPKLVGRALRLRGIKISRDHYVRILCGFAKELSKFYAGKTLKE